MVSALAAALLLALAPVPPAGTAGLTQVVECAGPGGTGAGGGLALAGVHELADGTGVRVAVIDTGVTPHPRLRRLAGGGDYLTGGSGLTDCDGHGTAVAGLLAATPGPDDEVGGLAPGVEIVSIRQASPSFTVPGPRGPQPAGDTGTLAAALQRAVQLGASVVTVSETVCVGAGRAAAVGAPLAAALRAAAEADVLVVAAAGNVGSGGCTGDPGEVPLPAAAGYPAAGPPGGGALADGVLTVGATTPTDAPASFTLPGPWVDLAARGTGLRSLAPGSGLTVPELQGTSMAVPIVAGTAALVRQRFPRLSAPEVAARLVATARRVPGERTAALGAGIIDPLAALTVVAGPAEPNRPATAPTIARTPAPGWIVPAAVVGLVMLAGGLLSLVRRLLP